MRIPSSNSSYCVTLFLLREKKKKKIHSKSTVIRLSYHEYRTQLYKKSEYQFIMVLEYCVMRKFVGKFLKHFFFFWVGVVELYSMQFFFFFNNCLDLEEVMVCRLVSNSFFFFFFQRLRLCLVECKIFSECKIFLGKENIFKCLAAL